MMTKLQRINEEQGGTSKVEEMFPRLVNRTSPARLVKCMKEMNDKQKQVVNELGFGRLARMNIIEIPLQLGYWLVKNFEARNCSLKLSDGTFLNIEENDVYRVFGFPRGTRVIKKTGSGKTNSLLDEWKGLFGGNSSIKPKKLIEFILNDIDGGPWFQRNFLILVVSCLVENSPNGYIVPSILESLDDLSLVKDLNWGQFLLNNLVRHRLRWNELKAFNGPALFLTIMYADRIHVFNQPVERKYPAMLNWDINLLHKREKKEIQAGGFGWECLLPPNENPIDEAANLDNNDQHSRYYSSRLISKANLVAKHMVELMKEIEVAPANIVQTDEFIRTVEACNDLIGIESKKQATQGPTPDNGFFDETFWRDDENWKLMEDIIAARAMRNDYTKKYGELPNFSLGLTQDFNNTGVGPQQVDQTTNEHQEGNVSDEAYEDLNEDEYVQEKNKANYGCEQNASTEGFEIIPDQAIEPCNIETSTEVGKDGNTNVGKVNIIVHEACGDQIQQASNIAVKEKPEIHNEEVRLDVRETRQTKRKTTKNEEMRKKEISNIDGKIHAQTSKGKEIVQHSGTQNDDDDFENDKNRSNKRAIWEAEASILQTGRKRTRITKTATLLSPYIQRVIDVSKQLTKDEKQLAVYTLHSKSDDDIIFENVFGKKLSRFDLKCCRNGKNISDDIIEQWCILLNKKEALCSKESRIRFFASPFLASLADWDEADIEEAEMNEREFPKQLMVEINSYHDSDLEKIDQFFFPFQMFSCHFLICIDTIASKIFLIDSGNDNEADCSLIKYPDMPQNLKLMFEKFLHNKKLDSKANAVGKATTSVVCIKWGSKENKVDSGVYLMRHMETFKGELNSSWAVGLRKNAKKQLSTLRIKYFANILQSYFNLLKDEVALKAYSYSYLLKQTLIVFY